MSNHNKKAKKRARRLADAAARSNTVSQQHQYATLGHASTAGAVPSPAQPQADLDKAADDFINGHISVIDVAVPPAVPAANCVAQAEQSDLVQGDGVHDSITVAADDDVAWAKESLVNQGFPVEALTVTDNRAAFEALSVTSLRPLSKGVFSGGYSLKKPALIDALIAHGVQPPA